MTDAMKGDESNIDPTQTYQQDGTPLFITLLFWALIIWGVAYSAYFLAIDFDSEALFDKRSSQQVEMKK